MISRLFRFSLNTKLVLLLFSCTLVMSLELPYKAFGYRGVVVYCFFLAISTIIFLNPGFLLWFDRWYKKNYRWLDFLFLLGIIILFFGLYSLENYWGQVFNPDSLQHGSDRDDVNNRGAQQILNFSYPYYVKSYLNNDLSSFPGGFYISLPFYFVFGNSALQNVFWMIVFFFFMSDFIKSRKITLLLMSFSFLSLPCFMNISAEEIS